MVVCFHSCFYILFLRTKPLFIFLVFVLSYVWFFYVFFWDLSFSLLIIFYTIFFTSVFVMHFKPIVYFWFTLFLLSFKGSHSHNFVFNQVLDLLVFSPLSCISGIASLHTYLSIFLLTTLLFFYTKPLV